MTKVYKERVFTEIVESICLDLDLVCELFSAGWCLRINNGLKDFYIQGYHFPVNTSSSKMIADDKHICSYVLKKEGVNTVDHILLSREYDYSGTLDMSIPYKYLKGYKKIIVKNPRGTMGTSVWMISNEEKLDSLLKSIFETEYSVCLSLFENIKEEYRAVVFNGEVLMVYKKNIPFVVGDGVNKLVDLLYGLEFDSDFVKTRKELDSIPLFGEKVYLSWQHNLSKFAEAEIVTSIDEDFLEISSMALAASEAIGIGFSSVDVIKTVKGEFKVMEINSGVMMEKFAKQSEEYFELARSLYLKVIKKMTSIN